MAEVTAFRNNALPYPVYGVPYTIVFPLLDADGDPVTGATCDSEVSINGDTGADCTNEGTEIPFTTATNKGQYYLTLTAAEMTGDIITVNIYSATSKATVVVLYPRKLVELASGTSQGGAAGYITLAASTVLFDNQYSGCLCVATIDTNVESRILGACTASNQQCAVSPSWNVTPDDNDTYKIYLPEGMRIPTVNIKAISDDTTAPDNLELMYDGTGYAGGTTKLQTDLVQVNAAAQTATLDTVYAAVSGIGTAGGAAINIDANTDNYSGGISGVTSTTTKVGTQTGTYANTTNVNGVYHVMTHDTQVVDIVYQFLTGGGTSPVGLRWIGIVNPINDTVTISAWRHDTNAWEAISTIAGQTSTTANVTKDLVLYARHRGTSAAELGKVYLRFNSSAAYNHILRTDQVIVTYAVTSQTVGYSMGAVWIDTVNGTDGYDNFVNGTADNPVKTIACALTIAAAVKLKNIQVATGSTITLAASAAGYNFLGKYWNLALGSQNIAGAYFEGANVSGIATGDDSWFHNCVVGTVTIPQAYFTNCLFEGTFTTVTGDNYYILDSYDGIAGDTNPVFVMTANTLVGIRSWAGGLNLNSMAATNVVVIDGRGKLILDSNCAAGEIRLRGNWDITDNVSGGFLGTFSKTANTPTCTSDIKVVVDLIEDINRNKLTINDSTGAVTLYADNSTTSLLTGTVSDDSTTTTRTRLA